MVHVNITLKRLKLNKSGGIVIDIDIVKRKLTEALVYMESYKQNHYEGYFNQMENSLYELSKELNKK